MNRCTCSPDNCPLIHFLGTERLDFTGVLYFEYRGNFIVREAIEDGARFHVESGMQAVSPSFDTIAEIQQAIDASVSRKAEGN